MKAGELRARAAEFYAQARLPHRALVALGAAAIVTTPALADSIEVVNGVYGAGAPSMIAPAPVNPNEVRPFVLATANSAERNQAVECLADAVYYEAGFEPVEGQRAVAQVILNRVRDPNFPRSVCGVVFQGFKRDNGCQFSFVCDGSMKRRPPKATQEREARVVAEQALNGYVEKEVGTATHYHTDWVHPYWAPRLQKITQIGDHIFYRWPGRPGEPKAFKAAYAGGEVAMWRQAATRVLGRA